MMLCKVRGTLKGPDDKPLSGVIRFLANRRGQTIGNALMLPAPVTVTLDAAGAFAVQLVPSSQVGEYTLRTPAGSFVVNVPDAPAARLNEIIVWSR